MSEKLKNDEGWLTRRDKMLLLVAWIALLIFVFGTFLVVRDTMTHWIALPFSAAGIDGSQLSLDALLVCSGLAIFSPVSIVLCFGGFFAAIQLIKKIDEVGK